MRKPGFLINVQLKIGKTDCMYSITLFQVHSGKQWCIQTQTRKSLPSSWCSLVKIHATKIIFHSPILNTSWYFGRPRLCYCCARTRWEKFYIIPIRPMMLSTLISFVPSGEFTTNKKQNRYKLLTVSLKNKTQFETSTAHRSNEKVFHHENYTQNTFVILRTHHIAAFSPSFAMN